METDVNIVETANTSSTGIRMITDATRRRSHTPMLLFYLAVALLALS